MTIYFSIGSYAVWLQLLGFDVSNRADNWISVGLRSNMRILWEFRRVRRYY